tara:strand:+ start:1235 stop:1762 length:528 start_codon:yes stop_codon:yes gene_type:complete
MIKTILVAIDGSPSGDKALDIAVELAAGLGAKLTIAHVLLHGEPPKDIERMARVEHMVPVAVEAARPYIANVPATMTSIMNAAKYTEGVERMISALGEKLVNDAAAKVKKAGVENVETDIRNGDYVEQILKAAKNASADMIVAGSRGLGPVKKLLIGSTSNKIVQLAPCPVLIAR